MKRIGYFLVCLIFSNFLFSLSGSAQLLPPPTLLSPPNNSQMPIGQAVQPVLFSWEASEGADEYEVNLLVQRPNQDPFPMQRKEIESTSVAIDLGLELEDTNTKITWSVRAIANGSSSVSPPFTFTTVASTEFFPHGLPAPELVKPEDKAMFTLEEALFGNNDAGIEFQWKNVSGASGYTFLLYQNNDQISRRNVNNTTHFQKVETQLEDVFQWEVRSIDEEGEEGQAGRRRSFRVGTGQLPTPTPFPVSPDMNSSGTINAEDVYQFASGFFTNDPKVDFDNSGLNDAEDILLFLQQYREQK